MTYFSMPLGYTLKQYDSLLTLKKELIILILAVNPKNYRKRYYYGTV